MSTNLGPNPVDPTLAFRAAVESSLDVMSSINECVENSRDWAKNISISLYGDPIEGRPGTIQLTSVVISDDGSGMDFATLVEKFRGAYYNSDSHDRTTQSGRNGVGVKTNLQYWNEIYVETTTNKSIPSKTQWKCSPNNLEFIENTYRPWSKLKPGAPDTEIRAMSMKVDGSELKPFKISPRDDSGTTITLQDPRQKIEFHVESFIRRQSHCIEWLSNKNHRLMIHYKNDQGKWIKKDVKPFFEIEGKNKFIAQIKGNSKEHMFIIHQDADGTKESIPIPANVDPNVGSIDLDIKLMERDNESENPHDFVLSICGANVYDRLNRKSTVSPAIEYFMGQTHFKMGSGFSYRLHGYIKTDDERLKRALRHNKSVLDEEDKYVKSFVGYIIGTILKPLHEIYEGSLRTNTDKEDKEILDEITMEFNNTMKRIHDKATQKKTESDSETDAELPKHKEFKCNECGRIWKVPLDKIPSYCAEFDITKEKGCGSRDIDRNSHSRNDLGLKNIQFQWVNCLGGFIPARYEPEDHRILLAMDHPSFITTAVGTKARTFKVTVGVEKAFIAMASYKSIKEQRTFDDVYGECLLEWFEHKSQRDPWKLLCRKIWKEHNINLDQI